MYKIGKISFILILASLFSASSINFKPVIPYGNYPIFNPDDVVGVTSVHESPQYIDSEEFRYSSAKGIGRFPLLIGYSKKDIRQYMKHNNPPELPYAFYDYEQKDVQGLDVLEVYYEYGVYEFNKSPNPPRELELAAYVFENGISVGVILWDTIPYYNLAYIPEYYAIISLPQDTSQLKEGLPHIPVKRFDLYQVPRQDGWTEKYGLLKIRLNKQDLNKYHCVNGRCQKTNLLLQAYYGWPQKGAEVRPLFASKLDTINQRSLNSRHEAP